jgi:hypothetical protein
MDLGGTKPVNSNALPAELRAVIALSAFPSVSASSLVDRSL